MPPSCWQPAVGTRVRSPRCWSATARCRWLRERLHDSWSWEALSGGRQVQEPLDGEPPPEAQAETADLTARVRRAVLTLPRGQRAAVMLYYLAGLTHAETAVALGIPVGSVKTRLHKARTALRRQLSELWKEETMATEEHSELVEVRVIDVRRSPSNVGFVKHVVFLGEPGGDTYLPIWVGPWEGTSIALALEGAQPPRPLTFAFMADLLKAAGGQLREVRISRLADEVYYAEAVVERPDGATSIIDARPSDALNLAVLNSAPIRVARSVLRVAEADPRGAPVSVASYRDVWGSRPGAADIASEFIAYWRQPTSKQARAPGRKSEDQPGPPA